MNNVTAPKEYKLSKLNTYYIFSLLFLLYFFDYVDRMIVTSLMPYIKLEYGLTDTQSGLLVSVVYWSIVAFVLPVSILVDRWSRKKTIGIMAMLWSMATLACAFTKTFPQLLMTRSAIGIGEAGYAPAGTAMLSGLFPPEKRSRMMGLWNMSIPLGIAVGIGVGGFVAQHWGWRHAFGLVALPGALIAILFFFVKDYKTVDLVQTVKPADTGKNQQQQLDNFTRSEKDLWFAGICGGLGESTSVPAWVWRLIFVIFGGLLGLVIYILLWLNFTKSEKDRWFAGICGGLSECTSLPSWLWRLIFIILFFIGFLGLLTYILIWIFYRKALFFPFLQFIQTPSLIFTYLGFIGCVFSNNAITTWLPTYYHRLEGLPLGEAGMKTGGILMLAVVGLPLGGWLADVWFKKRPSSRLLFPAITVALSSVVVFVAFSFLEGKAQYVALLLNGILGVGFVAAAITATQETVHAGLRAISYSVCVVVQNILGASMGPIVIGAFSDAYGIKVAMTILPVFLAVSALLFFAGSFFYEKDLKKVEKVTLECET